MALEIMKNGLAKNKIRGPFRPRGVGGKDEMVPGPFQNTFLFSNPSLMFSRRLTVIDTFILKVFCRIGVLMPGLVSIETSFKPRKPGGATELSELTGAGMKLFGSTLNLK